MSGFERYTPKAYDIMFNLTQAEAKKQGHELIGTEHLLLAILKDKDNPAAQALMQLGVTYDVTLDSVVALVGKYDSDTNDYRLPYSARMKSVCELAVLEANASTNQYIGPEHLLLALIREGEGIAAQVLNDFGVNKSYTAKMMEKIIKNYPGTQESTSNFNEKPGPPPKSNNSSQHKPQQQGGQQGKSKMVEKFGKDLTKMAEQNTLDPVIGREKEIERVIQILSRRTKNNPCLIGEPGVGKTAIAEGLAQKIYQGIVPETIKHKKVIALDLSGMIAGTKYRGEFEERLKGLVDEIIERKDIILFIDEFHTIIGAGAAEGAMDAANILKPSLARGEIQAIGATTLDEYRKHIEKDAALERRFQPVTVSEPTKEEAVQILFGLRDRYEAHHKLEITDDALIASVELSARYLTDRFLPDKAIDLMDEAASKVKISQLTEPSELLELEKEIAELEKAKVELISSQKYEEAASVRDNQKLKKEELAKARETWTISNKLPNRSKVTENEIAQILAQWTNIPVSKIKEEEGEKLLRLEETIHERVIGQDEAVTAVVKAVRRSRVGLKDPNRPIGSFIFLGPTGVGKTELCKALAEAVFGQESAIVRFDMSEYMEKHTVARLIGAPPGYVGYDDGGQLTEKVRRNPYSVVLFDEIEKAHPDIFNVLLQILDDGRITDGQGKTVDFKNSIIIMTSNVGAQAIRNQSTLGFGMADDFEQSEYETMRDSVLEELRRTFKPEFLNRLDEIIVFRKLNVNEIELIIEVLLKQFTDRVKPINIEMEFTEEFKAHIAKNGTNLEYGARPLKRTLQKELEDTMSEEMLKGNIQEGDHIIVDAKDNQVLFVKKERIPAQ
ncbi:MAG: ATP-dependent Clp protease ATP-binding subunit [Eubacteriaceae bacterium]|nr:ATP-dependent Clp protease ATP-binding subunit [Eubacteriaceae bacterium]